jgi:ribonuclease HI
MAEDSYKLSNNASIFQAEILAITKACEWLLYNIPEEPKKIIYIFSDSKSSLQALKKKLVTSRMVKKCKETINKLCERAKVELHWIKGHKNHTGNEVADALAKQGTTSQNLIETPLPFIFIKNKIEEETKKNWQQEWLNEKDKNGEPRFKHSKEIVKTVTYNKNYRKKLLKMPRNKLRTLISWITGHCTLNKHLNKMNLQPGDLCRYCQVEQESPVHLLLNCEYLEEKRREFVAKKHKDHCKPIISKITFNDWKFNKEALCEEKIEYIFYIYNIVKFRLDNDFIPP